VRTVGIQADGLLTGGVRGIVEASPPAPVFVKAEEDTYFDNTGKQLEDSRAANAHALRIIEKVRRFVPDADKSTWRIRITLPTGQSVMTVISRAVGDAPQKPFGKRSGPCLAPRRPS
jgi:hypothetical protein